MGDCHNRSHRGIRSVPLRSPHFPLSVFYLSTFCSSNVTCAVSSRNRLWTAFLCLGVVVQLTFMVIYFVAVHGNDTRLLTDITFGKPFRIIKACIGAGLCNKVTLSGSLLCVLHRRRSGFQEPIIPLSAPPQNLNNPALENGASKSYSKSLEAQRTPSTLNPTIL